MHAGVDVILDIMGASYLPRNINALAMDGRLFLLATQGGEIGEINLTSVIYRRLTVTGSFAPPTEPGFLVRFA
jgi:NADPH2:quinone reductase